MTILLLFCACAGYSQSDIKVEIGQFSTPASTGITKISTAFQPKGFILTWAAVSGETAEVDNNYGIGMADASDEFCFGIISEDGIDFERRFADGDSVLKIPNVASSTTSTPSWDVQAVFSSFASDGINLNFSKTTSGIIVNYIAFGGADLNANAGKATVSDGSVGSLGFDPDLIFAATNGATFSEEWLKAAVFGFGVANGTGEWYSASYHSDDGATINKGSTVLTSGVLGQWTAGDFGTPNWEMSSVTMGTGQFSWSGSNSDDFGYLALDVGDRNTYVDTLKKASSPQEIQMSFEPEFYLLVSGSITSLETGGNENDARYTIGAADGTNQWAFLITDEENGTQADQIQNNNNVLMIGSVAASVDADAIPDPFDSTPSITWTTDPATAYIIGLVGIQKGEVAGGGGTGKGQVIQIQIGKLTPRPIWDIPPGMMLTKR